MYADKLGLENHNGAADSTFFNKLFEVMPLTETDMTSFFRKLNHINHAICTSEVGLLKLVESAFYDEKNSTSLTPNNSYNS
ncbi:MAG: hypothetical protein KUG78_16740 [Kangiellaceae bacterium]|nr:hypothetical protein [Kangiellaceae bacterium]